MAFLRLKNTVGHGRNRISRKREHVGGWKGCTTNTQRGKAIHSILLPFILRKEGSSVPPVSYTHLDVYKRQGDISAFSEIEDFLHEYRAAVIHADLRFNGDETAAV